MMSLLLQAHHLSNWSQDRPDEVAPGPLELFHKDTGHRQGVGESSVSFYPAEEDVGWT